MEKIPADLKKALASAQKAKTIWDGLTPIARRDFISWIESAKQVETRKRRVDSVPSRLISGKRRPCCYALVPMNLYKAIGLSAKAKTTWKALTPDERRNFNDFVNGVKNKDLQSERIAKVIYILASGKKSLVK
ncbi:hypothetical protein A2837_00880 [Candidatus Kaiserbacteria bacterium RIFCSPHIGHO2_01_FULL_46_22]|uniref:Uncharacterized protein n=1 Tax=Candidatus Kaiserbacteria bacterium RIFCSPHIGHO2_01_FULL_46_22 TaxID=1798475 RepID=A0A1F6BXS9_9BACT|nr:MAG: hypothetical protein A2837_00880 [Candidatus Kaiserbacteria bacterium RIFCSPHIGHO2_01_FULL_46_22]